MSVSTTLSTTLSTTPPAWLAEFFKGEKEKQVFTKELNEAYYRVPGKRLSTYLREMPESHARLFAERVLISDALAQEYKYVDQKSDKWQEGRKNAVTGSNTGAFLGHNPYSSTLKAVWDYLFPRANQQESISKSSYVIYGCNNEPVARETYRLYWQKILNRLHKQPERWTWFGKDEKGVLKLPDGEREPDWVKDVEKRPYIKIRGAYIPLRGDPNTPNTWLPIEAYVEAKLGTLVHPHYKFLRLSPDGILMLNGIPLVALEIKCSLNGVYKLMPVYHGGQVTLTNIVVPAHFPTVVSTDYMSFYAGDEYSLATFWVDREFIQLWFMPRLIKLFFTVMWPVTCAAHFGFLSIVGTSSQIPVTIQREKPTRIIKKRKFEETQNNDDNKPAPQSMMNWFQQNLRPPT